MPPTQRPTKKFTALLSFKAGITFFPALVAKELGYYKDEGLDIDIQVVNGSSALVQQMGANNADFGISLSPNILLGFAEGVQFTAFYDFTRYNIFDVKVLDSSPIQAVKELTGKSIGIIDLTRGDVPFLRPILKKGGADPDKVNIVALGFDMATQAQALKDGRVDALNISWNNTLAIEAAGVKLRCLTCSTTDYQVASESIVVRNSVLSGSKDYVAAFGRAIAKATLFAETNPEAATAIMKKLVPEEQTDAAFALKFMKAAIDIMKPRKTNYGEADMPSWTLLQEQMLQFSSANSALGLKAAVDLTKLVSNALVAEMNDFDHAAVVAAAKNYKP